MALRGVAIVTCNRCKSKVLFKNNYGVYGGALYLETTNCPEPHAMTLEFFWK